jgi:hypothetical protein
VISARDAIWIDMVQFDVSAADRLWEGIPPAYGAPGWYDDVSGLIETASGPAEPHELVDEPVVVEDMRHTTLGGPRGCRQRPTLGRMIALKAAAATTASVIGIAAAAAAAATTGIVATVASVVVPVIEDHVLPVDDDREAAVPVMLRTGASGGGPDTRPDLRPGGQPTDPAAAPLAAASPAPIPAGPEPAESDGIAASASPVPTAPRAQTAEPAPAAEPVPAAPAAVPAPPPDPDGVAPTPPRVVEPPAATTPAPAANAPPENPRRRGDERVDAGTCRRNACPGRGRHDGAADAGHREPRARVVGALVDQPRPAHPRRPG